MISGTFDLVKLWEVAGALKRQEMCRAGCFVGWHRCKEVVDKDIATKGFYGRKGDKVFEERPHRFGRGFLLSGPEGPEPALGSCCTAVSSSVGSSTARHGLLCADSGSMQQIGPRLEYDGLS